MYYAVNPKLLHVFCLKTVFLVLFCAQLKNKGNILNVGKRGTKKEAKIKCIFSVSS